MGRQVQDLEASTEKGALDAVDGIFAVCQLNDIYVFD